jgi:phosphoserine phosphatase RsbU/P
LVTQVSPGSTDDGLPGIQVVIDAALARRGADDFLAELLVRAKHSLQADTATVLLLDYSTGYLVATAASGLEEEVRQGVRIRMGKGFAGRIAAENQPVIIDELGDTDVEEPILRARGLRSLLGVPLVADGQTIGVLHVGCLTARKFTSADIEVLRLAADQAASALRSLVTRADQVMMAVLQQSLMPDALPVAEGVEMAGRYLPGRGVAGGDWYDAFLLPSGQLGAVIGDAVGSGLRAAMMMERMRGTLRAYALEASDPAEVLRRVDRKIQHFEPGELATVQYAVIDRGLGRAYISSAGHLPPVLAVPGKPATLADITPGPMLGLDLDAPRHVTTIEILPGSVLCFYTDGLVEQPPELLDESLDRLCRAVTVESPDTVCSAVMQTMIGHEPVRDDIAMLTVRLQPPAVRPTA